MAVAMMAAPAPMMQKKIGMAVGGAKDTDNFIAAQSGRFEITSHGLTSNEYYFVSDATSGTLTSTEPNTYSNPLIFGINGLLPVAIIRISG